MINVSLRAAGIATIVAAGNEALDGEIGAPACLSNAVAVGATNKADHLASYSNHSSLIDLLAPGSRIRSARLNGGLIQMSGTSQAAPHVAGAWAALRSLHPTILLDTLQNTLSETGYRVATRPPERPRIDLLATYQAINAGVAIEVNIEPTEAREAGAAWRLGNEPNEMLRTSGSRLEAEGDLINAFNRYTVHFNDVEGWESPASVEINLQQERPYVVNVTYTKIATPSPDPVSEGSGGGGAIGPLGLLLLPLLALGIRQQRRHYCTS